jgi:hypothetical protein
MHVCASLRGAERLNLVSCNAAVVDPFGLIPTEHAALPRMENDAT